MEVLVYFCKNWRQESGFRESHRCIPDDSVVKNLPSKQEMWVQSLVWKDPLEEEMATHSSIHAWKIPWTEEPGGLQSMESQRVWHDCSHTQRWVVVLDVVSWIAFTEHVMYVRNSIHLISMGTHNILRERTRAQSSMCWRGSLRGPNPWLTQELDPGNQRFLTPSPVVGILFPQWELFSRKQPWESKVLLRESRYLTKPSSGLCIESLDSYKGVWRCTCLEATQSRLCM